MKIRRKKRNPVSQLKSQHNIVGCLLEDAHKPKKQYKDIEDVFGADAIDAIENICRESPSRELAITQIKKFLESRVNAINLDYVAAVLEASFRNKFDAERIEHELHDKSSSG